MEHAKTKSMLPDAPPRSPAAEMAASRQSTANNDDNDHENRNSASNTSPPQPAGDQPLSISRAMLAEWNSRQSLSDPVDDDSTKQPMVLEIINGPAKPTPPAKTSPSGKTASKKNKENEPAFTLPIPDPTDPAKHILRNPWDATTAVLDREADIKAGREFFAQHVTNLPPFIAPEGAGGEIAGSAGVAKTHLHPATSQELMPAPLSYLTTTAPGAANNAGAGEGLFDLGPLYPALVNIASAPGSPAPPAPSGKSHGKPAATTTTTTTTAAAQTRTQKGHTLQLLSSPNAETVPNTPNITSSSFADEMFALFDTVSATTKAAAGSAVEVGKPAVGRKSPGPVPAPVPAPAAAAAPPTSTPPQPPSSTFTPAIPPPRRTPPKPPTQAPSTPPAPAITTKPAPPPLQNRPSIPSIPAPKTPAPDTPQAVSATKPDHRTSLQKARNSLEGVQAAAMALVDYSDRTADSGASRNAAAPHQPTADTTTTTTAPARITITPTILSTKRVQVTPANSLPSLVGGAAYTTAAGGGGEKATPRSTQGEEKGGEAGEKTKERTGREGEGVLG